MFAFNSIFHLSLFPHSYSPITQYISQNKARWHRKCSSKTSKTKRVIIFWKKTSLFLMVFVICLEALMAWTKPPCYTRVSHSFYLPSLHLFVWIPDFFSFFFWSNKNKIKTSNTIQHQHKHIPTGRTWQKLTDNRSQNEPTQ